MNVSVDTLLEPLSPDNPCGEDIGYDPQFIELESMLLGKPETQFAAAEEPDWKGVTKECLDLFQRSKDLRVALRLALGLLKMQGLPGFRDGLRVIKGLVENYWEPVHPRLDPDDDNDPLERVNILATLTTPMGTFGDPFQFLLRLRQAPLTDSSQAGAVGLLDIEKAASGTAGDGLTTSQIQGALRASNPEKVRAVYDAIIDSEVATKELDDILTKTVGASRSVAFDALAATLKELQKVLAPYVGSTEGATQGAVSDAQDSGASGRSSNGGSAISGEVRSREDVVRVLDQICDFFARSEPSSPVPLLLKRARRLVNLDFVELLTDLSPDALAQIKLIAGIRGENWESGGEPAAE